MPDAEVVLAIILVPTSVEVFGMLVTSGFTVSEPFVAESVSFPVVEVVSIVVPVEFGPGTQPAVSTKASGTKRIMAVLMIGGKSRRAQG